MLTKERIRRFHCATWTDNFRKAMPGPCADDPPTPDELAELRRLALIGLERDERASGPSLVDDLLYLPSGPIPRLINLRMMERVDGVWSRMHDAPIAEVYGFEITMHDQSTIAIYRDSDAEAFEVMMAMCSKARERGAALRSEVFR